MSATNSAPAQLSSDPQPSVSPPTVKPPGRGWTRIAQSLPNIVVFSLLGTVMIVGHHTNWKLPRLSQLIGAPADAAATDNAWCAEHLVPELDCIECRPNLLQKPKPFGFCREHGVAECVIHHPELAQVKGAPQLPQYDTARAITLVSRPVNNSRNTLHAQRVQFSSAEAMKKVGVDVDLVQERPMLDAITANGELIFDPTRVAHLSSRVAGTVAAVNKAVGDRVQAGEILALVDASQVGHAKSQLLQSVVQLNLRKNAVERLRPVSTSGAVAQKSLIEAEAALQEASVALVLARQALANLGFDIPEDLDKHPPETLAGELQFLDIPPSLLAALPLGSRTANLLPIRATFDGVLTDSEVVAGEVVDSTRTLFTVCDPKRMWLVLHVRPEDAKSLRTGLPVRFQSDNGEQHATGVVTWISPSVDEQTRTLRVRVPVANEDHSLRDKTFGAGQIVLREEPHAVVVPREAVQSTPDATFVFVRDKNFFTADSPKFFHVRQVRLGASDGQFVELLAGVLPGEVVATKGSNVLLAQLLRSNLGAGCGCHDH